MLAENELPLFESTAAATGHRIVPLIEYLSV